jgi:hypothetical protein
MPALSRKVLSICSLFVALVILVGCHKSAKETAEEDAIKRHEQEMARRGPSQEALSNHTRTPEGTVFRSEGVPPKNLGQLVDSIHDGMRGNWSDNEVPISLRDYVNANLNDPLDAPQTNSDNNLVQFPAGIHKFGGVPFDVSGTIQLAGTGLPEGVKSLPTQVTNILIGRKCQTLSILHGATGIQVETFGSPVASLVLHYSDGSRRQLQIMSGSHVLNCIAQPMPPNLAKLDAKTTELAWLGDNKYLNALDNGKFLHLYRTTFENPLPKVQVESIDYVSAMGNPAPFMVGLTIQ